MTGEQGFGIWITGLPASGKSTIANDVAGKLKARGVAVVVLESDVMRTILTPEPTYSEEERDRFYRTLALIGEVIAQSGVNVIFDATANKRAYRDRGRRLIKKFVEVHVECPLEVCAKRDPKGIYAKAALKKTATVPGVQSAYEPPLHAELILDGQASAEASADRILDKLKQFLYI